MRFGSDRPDIDQYRPSSEQHVQALPFTANLRFAQRVRTGSAYVDEREQNTRHSPRWCNRRCGLRIPWIDEEKSESAIRGWKCASCVSIRHHRALVEKGPCDGRGDIAAEQGADTSAAARNLSEAPHASSTQHSFPRARDSAIPEPFSQRIQPPDRHVGSRVIQ
jgi:hypothetical protein